KAGLWDVYRPRVPRLVQHHLHTPGKHEHDGDAIPLILRLAPHLNPLGTKLGDRALEVIAHESKLMPHPRFPRRALRGMHAKLRRRQLEDQPPPARIDMLEPKDITQHRA